MRTLGRFQHFLKCLVPALILLSCQKEPSESKISAEELSPPLSGDAMQPYLHAAGDDLIMTWTELNEEGNPRLVMSTFADGAWKERVELAKGEDWFVNWADFPALSKNGGSMVSHFLKKSDSATFSYDINYLHSADGGESWSEPQKMHSDTVRAEHGFVSFAPEGSDSFLAVWLDGRNTSTGDEIQAPGSHEGHGGEGAMQLRSGHIDASGRITGEQLIDDRTCDCCQTSLVRTVAGTLVAYRDRSENEIRDIYLSMRQEGAWSTPKPVYTDNWKIAGCPVNGPKLASHDNTVCLVWFTAANDQPEVKIAFSDDGGLNFGLPFRMDEGLPMGRVDVHLLDGKTALLSWMESVGEQAQVRLALAERSSGKVASFGLGEVSGARSTGFPQLEVIGKQVFMAWNETGEDKRRIKLVRLDLEEIYP